MAKLPNIIEKDRSLWEVVKFVFKNTFKGSRYSTHVFLFSTMETVFMFIEFGALGLIINELTRNGIENARISFIILNFCLIIFATFIPSILNTIQFYFKGVQGNDLTRFLQKNIFDKMYEIDLGTAEQSEFRNILDFAGGRGWGSFFAVGNLIFGIIRNALALIIASISIIIVSPILFFILVVSVLPTYYFERRNAELDAIFWKGTSERRRSGQAKVLPIYEKHSFTELKNFHLIKIFYQKWERIFSKFHSEENSLKKKASFYEVGAAVCLAVGYSVVFFLIIQKVYLGALAIGSLVYTFAVVTRVQSALQAIFENFGRMTEHKKNVSSLMDLIEMEPLVKSGTREIDLEDFKNLEMKNVSFTYPGSEKPVIHNMNLFINHTDSLAIVGLNGAGKTTLIKLLTRVYDPTTGEILINGINLKEYDLKAWKKCLGILLQDYTIYNEETIAENIMLGDTSKHDQVWVESVAQETTADVFIQELPEKYEQRVGTEFQGGVELSKGQKQKLALARVLYRNAPIIILDEPTAAIDALSEDTIFKNLRDLHKHQTRIIISHKFSNVRDADKIILIEHGNIIEQGSHDELMQIQTGKYKELFNLQAEGYQDKPKRKKVVKSRKTKEIQEVAQ